MNAVALALGDTERQAFADLSTEELLAMAKKTCARCDFERWSRDMLLALFHNRHGKYVPAP